MRHLNAGRKFSRTEAHRQAMFRSIATSLFRHERIEQTDEKAKELRRVVEKLITLAKAGDLHSRRLAHRDIRDQDVLHKLFAEVGPRFKARNGGYTRITKSRIRRGDNATLSILELVGSEVPLGKGGESSND